MEAIKEVCGSGFGREGRREREDLRECSGVEGEADEGGKAADGGEVGGQCVSAPGM